jgi:peptidoglycan/LPS O-acetylase OafA/YrhL
MDRPALDEHPGVIEKREALIRVAPIHIPELDGLRAVTALMVMVFHFTQLNPGPAFLQRFAVMRH